MRCLQAQSHSGGGGGEHAANPGPWPSYLLHAWTPDNTDTDVPGSFQYSSAGGSSGPANNSDIYVQPADFLKIRNVSLSYDIPQDYIGKLGMRSATVRFQLDNLPALWTKNNVGVDPETLGIRRLTSFIFGINVNF